MNVSSITQEEKCLEAWQLISCRWITGTVKWRVFLLTSVIPRFHPFGKKEEKRVWICLSVAFGKLMGCVWLSSLFCTRCVGCCMNFFTRLPHHHISAECLKERLIVVYCFGEWGTLLIRWRLFFLLFTALLRKSLTGSGRQLCHHQLFWNAAAPKAIFSLPGSLIWCLVEPPLQNLERRLISMLVKYRRVSLYSGEPESSASPMK